VSRPRSAESHAAILQAAVELVVEGGLRGTSIEGIAARAGVGKTTIYRRWRTKEELFAEALRGLAFELPDPDTGSVREDLLGVFVFNFEHMPRNAALLMPRLMVEGADDPALFAVMRAVLVDPRRDRVKAILRRGVQRAELRDDIDLDDIVDLLVGPLVYEVLITGADMAKVAEKARRIVDLVVTRIASPGRARRPPAA
jgi:AcrR family transcriptional regulator